MLARARAPGLFGLRVRTVAVLACAVLALRALLLRPGPRASSRTSSLFVQHNSAASASRVPADTAVATKVKVGWVGHVFGERPPSGLSFQEAQPICTDNSGNLVWAYGAWQLVDPEATELVPLVAPPFHTPVHAVLLPTANMLVNASKYSDVADYTHILTNILNGVQPQSVPILLIAIGSQVEFEEAGGSPQSINDTAAFGAAHIALHPEQIAFLRRITDSGGMMTTRGTFTQQIVAANGLPPPLPLSCPSLFLNHNPALGAVLQRKWDAVLAARHPLLRLAVTLPNIPADEAGARKYEVVMRFIAEHVLKPYARSAVVMLQTTRDVDTLELMRIKYGAHVRPDRVRYFYDVQAWADGMQACCDFVFGFRIHGTVMGVAAEVPGIVIAPDIRVKELADAMNIPTIDMDKLNMNVDKFELFDFIASVSSYGDRFDARRQEVAQIYMQEFQKLGVPLHPGIANIAEQQV